ncbi:ATP-dependent zinc metalloprotease FtsH [Candidatus Berkelbacteria bacterium]|nr:ATP-dependent zinc metalloprotease FtsH [Candidatus Berkelbacteria bacterium]
MNPQSTRSILSIVLVILAGLVLFAILRGPKLAPKDSTISEIATLVQAGQVVEVTVNGDEVIATLKDDAQLRAFKEAGVGLSEYGITPAGTSIAVSDPSSGALVSSLVSIFLPFILIALFFWFLLRQAQSGNMRAMSFGKSQARLASGGAKKITFDDVAGAREAKQELMEVVDFLKHPGKFRAIGAEIPKGVLLVGPPGVGKTLLAKAVAGEAGVPFFSLSASEFVEMFVGVGASRVRDLFAKAKRNAPAVIFIDELDAIGRQRGAGLGGSHDEREQTLNQILVEMDGFETDARVILMAATNRPDVLDPALLRPGRFDRRVVMELPDRDERREILELHAHGKPMHTGVNYQHVAGSTPGASGADLRNIINEAAILAARAGRKTVAQRDLDHAIEKVLIGPERQSRLMNEQEKRVAAYHEVGHALVGHFLPHADPIHKISLVSRGSALGYTWSLPEEDRRLITRSKFEDDIAQLLGGRVAEQLIFDEMTTGAENDLKKATRIARDMVSVYGMSDTLGPVQYGQREEHIFLGREIHEHRPYSEAVAEKLDHEVRTIVERAEKKAQALLTKHRTLLETVTTELLAKETIERAEFGALVAAPTA